LYNRTRLTDEALDHGLATHRYIRIEGPILLHNPFCEAPAKAATHRSRPHGLKRKIRYIEAKCPAHSNNIADR
jgi:hypothetical protein